MLFVVSSCIFSIMESWMVWLIIWLVSMGALGFWFLSWATSRDMKTSESMVCTGARTAAAWAVSPAAVTGCGAMGWIVMSRVPSCQTRMSRVVWGPFRILAVRRA